MFGVPPLSLPLVMSWKDDAKLVDYTIGGVFSSKPK
jgi:hypothetical protein